MERTLRFGEMLRCVAASSRVGGHKPRRWTFSGACVLAAALGAVVAGLPSDPYAHPQATQTPSPDASAARVGSSGAASVAGRVTMADGGQPVAGVRVRLAAVPASPSSAVLTKTTGMEARTTATDASGAFVFSEVSSGRFAVYVTGPSGTICRTSPAIISLSAAETARLEFQLERTSSVAGRVVGDGRAVAGARVWLLSWNGPVLGPRRLIPVVRQDLGAPAPTGVTTGAQGEFVFRDVAPGEYYLMAQETFRRPPGQFQPRIGLQATYYPNALSLASARPLSVRSGANLDGVEIQMVRSRFAQVSGRVVDSAGRPLPSWPMGEVSLYSMSDVPSVSSSSSVVRFGASPRRGSDDGSFLCPDVAPGDYYLVALVLSPDDPGTGERFHSELGSSTPQGFQAGQRFWEREGAFVRVHVSERSEQKVDMRTNTGATISGRVVVESQPSSRPIDQEATLVVTTDSDLMPSSIGVSRRAPVRNGAFVVERLRGWMTVWAEAPGLAVKSVMRGTEDWTARSIDFAGTERVSDVVVTMTREVASLEGVVTGYRGPVAVIVYPEERARWRMPYVMSPRSSTGEAARLALTAGAAAPPPADAQAQQAYFSMTALLPGLYLVAAVPARRNDGLSLDAWLERLTPRATRVTLSAGDHQRVTLSASN